MLEKITKREADRLMLHDVKKDLVIAGLSQGSTISGYYSMFAYPDSGFFQVLGGLSMASGLLITVARMSSAYNKVKKYLHNPQTYIQENYSKQIF